MHPALGHYYFPLQNKVPSCPLSLPPHHRVVHYLSPPPPLGFRHNAQLTSTIHPPKKIRSSSSKSKSSIQWLEAKAKALAERVAAQKIPGRRVRNHTARRLACRCVIPPWCIMFALVMRPPICDPRLHRIHSEEAPRRVLQNIRLRSYRDTVGCILINVKFTTYSPRKTSCTCANAMMSISHVH